MEVLPGPAAHLAAHAGLAVLGLVEALVLEVDQGVEGVITDQVDAATVAAIAAIGAALGHVLLPAEAEAAVAPLAGLHDDRGFVDELHLSLS